MKSQIKIAIRELNHNRDIKTRPASTPLNSLVYQTFVFIMHAGQFVQNKKGSVNVDHFHHRVGDHGGIHVFRIRSYVRT